MPTLPDLAERQAVALLKNGDLAGLETLVEKYQLQAVRAAYLILCDPAEAQDVVQDAFLKAYQKIGRFDAERAFGPWFLKSVVHASLKAAHRGRRMLSLQRTQTEIDQEADGWLADPSGFPEELAEQADAGRRLWQAVARLTPDQRAAVMLRYYAGLSEEEMTRTLRRPLTTVKWWLHAARRRLRELLEPSRVDCRFKEVDHE